MTEPRPQRTPIEQIATDIASIRTSVTVIAALLVGGVLAGVLFLMIWAAG